MPDQSRHEENGHPRLATQCSRSEFSRALAEPTERWPVSDCRDAHSVLAIDFSGVAIVPQRCQNEIGSPRLDNEPRYFDLRGNVALAKQASQV